MLDRGKARVALTHGTDRRENVRNALKLVEGDLKAAVAGKRLILIKPNFVVCYRQLAATHVDAVRGVLDVVTPLTDGRIVIAEGAAIGPTAVGYYRYGYRALKREYGVELLNLNRDRTVDVPVSGARGTTKYVPIAQTALAADCRLSVALLKTHDTVVATMSYKNMAMGVIAGVLGKRKMHQGYAEINRSLATLAERVAPHFAVIDGMEGMEGNGPAKGTPVPLGVALAGNDFVAVDATGARLMGIDPRQIGYLWQCHQAGHGQARAAAIEVVGEALTRHVRPFKLHAEHGRQVAHLGVGGTG